MHNLTSSQVRGLRARGQTIKATVQLGRLGFSPSVRNELEQALLLNDLVKISIPEKGRARKGSAEEIARQMRATCVGIIGSSALLYRPKIDKEEGHP